MKRFGFFGGLQGAYIKNIKFRNPTLTTANHNYVGVVAAVANNTKIEHIQVLNGSITITGTHEKIGGIVGGAYASSQILQCSNNATITATGSSNVAGICGVADHIDIQQCVNKASVSADSYVAGIASYFISSDIDNCYNKGALTGKTTCIGGICAINASEAQNGYIQHSYNAGIIQTDNSCATQNVGGILGIAFCCRKNTILL